MCPHPVPIERAVPVEHINSIDQILAAGVQVFFVSDKANSEIISRSLPDSSMIADHLGSLVKSGELVWENQSRDICPARAIIATLAPAETGQVHARLRPFLALG